MKTVLILAMLLALPTPSFALFKKGVNKVGSYKVLKEKAKILSIQITGREIWIKKDIQKLMDKDRAEYMKKVFNDLDNEPEYLSYLREMYVGQGNAEKAKIIGKFYLYEAIRKNWAEFSQSILNDIAAQSFEEFRPYLKRKIRLMKFAPIRLKSPEGKKLESFDLSKYRFTMPEWGVINVSKDFKKVDWFIDLYSRNDANRLQKGVEKIKIVSDLSDESNI